MSETFNLFVYGSLKRGGPAEHLLEGAEWLGAATVGGILYDIDGEYRALVLYGPAQVGGEIWKCPWQLLEQLDAYENTESGLFRRIGVRVAQDGNAAGIACWTYVAGPALAGKLTPARRADAGARRRVRKRRRTDERL